MSSRKKTYWCQHRKRKPSWFHKAALVGTETAKMKDKCSIQTQFAPEVQLAASFPILKSSSTVYISTTTEHTNVTRSEGHGFTASSSVCKSIEGKHSACIVKI